MMQKLPGVASSHRNTRARPDKTRLETPVCLTSLGGMFENCSIQAGDGLPCPGRLDRN